MARDCRGRGRSKDRSNRTDPDQQRARDLPGEGREHEVARAKSGLVCQTLTLPYKPKLAAVGTALCLKKTCPGLSTHALEVLLSSYIPQPHCPACMRLPVGPPAGGPQLLTALFGEDQSQAPATAELRCSSDFTRAPSFPSSTARTDFYYL